MYYSNDKFFRLQIGRRPVKLLVQNKSNGFALLWVMIKTITGFEVNQVFILALEDEGLPFDLQINTNSQH